MTKDVKSKVISAIIVMVVASFVFTAIPKQGNAQPKDKPNKEHAKDADHTDDKDTLDSKETYKDLIEKATTARGVFDVHKVKNDYYFEIADSLMGRDMLIVNKISGVNFALNGAGVNKGMGTGEKCIRFYADTVHKKVMVVSFDGRVSSPENDAITRSVKDNYRETIIEYFDIEAFSPDSSSVLIKVNKVFDGSNKSFNAVFSDMGVGGSVTKDLSKINHIKSFPKNIVVNSTFSTTHSEQGGSVPLTIDVTSNIVLLDKVPMKPRFGDNRVGIFTTGHLYYNDNQQKVEERELINRWKLEPKPEDTERYLRGELVEPAKPIVFHIDPATPPVWVPYIIKGVEEWQAAFEQAGFKNAIYAVEVDTTRDKDFDIDDIRYSVITYAASEEANAMGPSVVDPRSGEIIEADIIWWHNVMSVLQAWIRVQLGAVSEDARGNTLPTEMMGNAIRFVSSHELGHSLGLMHNMGASYSVPVDSLRSKTYTASHGTASSIMDYARFNYVAQPEDGIEELTPQIGKYDKHAIEWGYRWYDTTTPWQELPLQNKMLRDRENDIECWYGEQSREGIDPRSQIEDLGDDPVRASEYGVKNLQRMMPHIKDWTFQEGELQYTAGNFLLAIAFQWKMYADHVAMNVGGYHINNVVSGHDIERYVPVDAARQQQSVEYLIDNVFDYPSWLFDDKAWSTAYAQRMSPIGMIEYSPLNLLRELQYSAYYSLLGDDRLARMYETEALLGRKNTYTPETMMSQITDAVFASKGRKALSVQERMSQKSYVDALIVNTNIIMAKTNVLPSAIKAHDHNHEGCTLMHSTPEVNLEKMMQEHQMHQQAMDDASLYTNRHYYFMKRVTDMSSAKRAAMREIRKIAQKRSNVSDQATANHYRDLVQRLDQTLNR